MSHFASLKQWRNKICLYDLTVEEFEQWRNNEGRQFGLANEEKLDANVSILKNILERVGASMKKVKLSGVSLCTPS